jgi:hypothetical protein
MNAGLALFRRSIDATAMLKIVYPWLLSTAVTATSLGLARDASALGPVNIELGGKIGEGTNPTGDVNPLGFGLGARGGVSFFNIYAGLSFMYYFGHSETVPPSSEKRSGKSVLYGFEGGYDFDIVHVVIIRPQLGVGVFNGNYGGGGFTTDTADGKNLYLEPGATVVVPLGLLFVGGDANAIFLPGQSGARAGFTFHGSIGVRF